MPRYFFDLADGSFTPDHDGTELNGLTAARLEAVRFAGQMMQDNPEVPWFGHDFRVEVSDSDKNLLFTVVIVAIDAPHARALSAEKV